ncbi:MAG: hypothetical protein WCP06_14265, partial [Verrucomicrobiota bacterium]
MVLFIGGCSFLFGDKIITTRFRAWQRFSLLMSELFPSQSLCPACLPPAGQALPVRGDGLAQPQGAGLGG